MVFLVSVWQTNYTSIFKVTEIDSQKLLIDSVRNQDTNANFISLIPLLMIMMTITYSNNCDYIGDYIIATHTSLYTTCNNYMYFFYLCNLLLPFLVCASILPHLNDQILWLHGDRLFQQLVSLEVDERVGSERAGYN